MQELASLYDDSFYHQHIKGMSQSAEIILKLLYQHYTPEKVIDIGCGQGAWLQIAETLGSKVLCGFDGDWVNRKNLLSQTIKFHPIDFEKGFPEIIEKYDLCISLEVAEHVSERLAAKFVDFLCSASDVVLFSAAIKYQGGVNHINEQWQSYWIDLFQSKGYECIDLFRGNIWHNPLVEWWYRQNVLLFVGPNNSVLNKDSLRLFVRPIYDIVHPVNYEIKYQS